MRKRQSGWLHERKTISQGQNQGKRSNDSPFKNHLQNRITQTLIKKVFMKI